MTDVGEVLSSLHTDRISVVAGGKTRALPQWAGWMMWLGIWMRSQSSRNGRRIAVVRLPTRRLAGAFVGLGALLASSRLHDDGLDWETLCTLAPGTELHWKEPGIDRATTCRGSVEGLREVSGTRLLAITNEHPRKRRGSTTLLSSAKARTYSVTLAAVMKRTDARLVSTDRLFDGVVDGKAPGWAMSPSPDGLVVTELSTFRADLEQLDLVVDGLPAVSLADALLLADLQRAEHGRMLLLPRRARTVTAVPGVTVLDGASAIRHVGNSEGRSVVILLDHAEYDEEIVNLLNPFIAFSIDSAADAFDPSAQRVAPPLGIDVFAFGLPGRAAMPEGLT